MISDFDWGLKCPSCGSDKFRVFPRMGVDLLPGGVTEMGETAFNSEPEDSDPARCLKCMCRGSVSDFRNMNRVTYHHLIWERYPRALERIKWDLELAHPKWFVSDIEDTPAGTGIIFVHMKPRNPSATPNLPDTGQVCNFAYVMGDLAGEACGLTVSKMYRVLADRVGKAEAAPG